MSLIRMISPAKINLGLKILGLREDGFHEVKTHLLQVDLFDHLVIGKRRRRIDISVDNSSIKGKENIIYKAANLLRDECGDKELGAIIHLEKKIPIGAGLGGGSGNAACVLWILNKLWRINYSTEKLESLAKKLGADVPFFLGGPSYIFEGKGDKKLYPCKFSSRNYVLIVKPLISLSTHDVYGWSREKILKSRTKYNQPFTLSKRYDCRENDLEKVVFPRYPFLREYKEKLLAFGSKLALLSGSGSAIFGIFSKKKDIVNAFNFFSSKKKLWVSVVKPLERSILKNSNFKF